MAPCDKCCTFLHHSPVSVDWLYRARASGPKFGSVTVGDKQIFKRVSEGVLSYIVILEGFVFGALTSLIRVSAVYSATL